jgi:hypothetical protein
MSEAPNQNPNPDPANPPAPSVDLAAPPAPSPQATKPDGLPDRYWDPDAGLRVREVAETLTAFDADQARLATTFKDFPKEPAKAADFYKLPENLLPEGMTAPEGQEIKPNTALLEKALPVLHKHRIAPDVFQDLARTVTAYELEKFQAAATEFAEDGKKLGTNGPTRRKDVNDRLAAMLGPEDAKFIDATALTSAGVEFFEKILKKVTSQSNVIPLNRGGDNDPPPQPQPIEQRWYGGTPQKAS